MTDDTCGMCGKRMKDRYRLYDRDGEVFSESCSRECAEHDAVGPRLRPYKIRKLPRRMKK